MNNVMIDIETLSTKPNAKILSIAAIRFDPNLPIHDINYYFENNLTFYKKINLNSLNIGKWDVDQNTLNWWKKQKKEVYDEAFNGTRTNITQILLELKTFINYDDIIWANSPSFDCVILKNTFNTFNQQIPWHWWNQRDLRTALHLAKINSKKEQENINFIQHNPLHDCFFQILLLKKSYKILF